MLYEDTKMTEKDKELMKLYGITTETKVVYLYDKYKYDKLSDAVQNAKIELKNSHLKEAFDTSINA